MQERRVGERGQARQLVGGSTGALHVAGGDRDLDERLQQRDPVELDRGLVDRPPDHRERRRPATLGQAEERQPGLLAPAPSAGLAVRGLGGIELAAKPEQLRLDVVGLADGRRGRWAEQPRLRAPDLLRRLGPRLRGSA